MVHLGDFEVLHYLGEGSYGRVIQARKQNGDDINKVFAIKSVPIKYKGSARERNILTRIKHPMVVELFYIIETSKKLYFVLEYLCGGTLSSVLTDNNGAISEQDASFYVKESIVALEYLHSEGIMYRDLKHSNILLDINGHIKLIDFGLSEENITPETLSFISCGTPYYKAPEIVNKTGHGFAVDWWSLGILFYRMVAGRYPFGGSEEKMVKKAIIAGNYTLPEKLTINAKDLITRLLLANPQERLGSTDDATAVKNHPYFADTVWEKVFQRLETPPFVPDVEDANDTSRFRIRIQHSSTSSTSSSSSSDSSSSSSTSNNSPDNSPTKKIKLDRSSSMELESTSAPQVTELLTTSPATPSQETVPSTSAQPTTTSPETLSQEIVPPTTVQPTIASPETLPQETVPPTTAQPTIASPETSPQETVPPTTAQPTKVSPETSSQETVPPTTTPLETAPPTI